MDRADNPRMRTFWEVLLVLEVILHEAVHKRSYVIVASERALGLALSGRGDTCPRSAAYGETMRTTEHDPSPSVPMEKGVCEKNAMSKVFIRMSFASRLVIAVRNRL